MSRARAAGWVVLASLAGGFGCSVETLTIRVRDAGAADALPDAPSADRSAPVDAADVPSTDLPTTDRVDAPAEPDAAADVPRDAVADAPIDAPTDVPPSCASPRLLCSGVCRDALSDPGHCGACGNACGAERACFAGACAALVQRSCDPSRVAGCGMAAVPGATFVMGDPSATGGSGARPTVTVTGFAIDRYEVTVARFRRYWDAARPAVPGGSIAYPGGRALPWTGPVAEPDRTSNTSGCNWSAAAGPYEGHPINCVDWHTAQAFCVWDGGRLPTEAEWELAARGTDGRLYPWGDGAPGNEPCWRSRSPVPDRTCEEEGSGFGAGASPVGAWHLSGNVWEWAADNVGAFGGPCWPLTPLNDPLCSTAGEDNRTIRGGSWENELPASVRAGARNAYPITRQGTSVGFRCARQRG